MDPVRLVPSAKLLDFFGAEFRVLESGGGAPFDMAALTELVDVARSAGAPAARAGVVFVELAGRSAVRADLDWLAAVLRGLTDILAQRPACICEIDIALVLGGLFSADGEDATPADELPDRVAKIEAACDDSDAVVGFRVWLVDSEASDGSRFRPAELAPAVQRFDARLLAQELGLADSNCLAIGIKTISFPRARILGYLSSRFALSVLEREKWLAGGSVPSASVARMCSEFIDHDLRGVFEQMEKYPDGTPIVKAVAGPAFGRESAAERSMQEVENRVRALVDEEYPIVQSQLVVNQAAAVATLDAALDGRVAVCIDETADRVVMALAFLELLGDFDERPHVVGDYVDTGKARTLQQAFAGSIEFFDRGAQFDSSKRAGVAALREDRAMQGELRETMVAELKDAQEKQAAGELSAAAEAEALEAEIASADAELGDMDERLLEGARDIKKQDWQIQRNRKGILREMLAGVEAEVSAAREVVIESDTAVAAAEQESARLRAELRSALMAMAIRVIGLALGLALVLFVGLLTLPLVFGAVPVVGGPLFGLVGTAVGVVFVKYWAGAFVISLVAYGVVQVKRYVALKRRVREQERAVEMVKEARVRSLTMFWQADVQRFTTLRDWTKHSHVYDTVRHLERSIEAMCGELLSFSAELSALRERERVFTQQFTIVGTATEEMVVDKGYADKLVDKSLKYINKRAEVFFQPSDSRLSVYFGRWCADGSGVDRFTADVHEFCAKEPFAEVRCNSVVGAVKETGYSLVSAVKSTPVFLAVDRASQDGASILVKGADLDYLRGCLGSSSITPAPSVIASDDEEHIVIYRVVGKVSPGDLTQIAPR